MLGSKEIKDKNVVVKLKYPSDKAIVFGNVSKLKGKKNAQKSAYCISEDKTDEKEELRKQYRMLVKKNEEQEDDDKKFKSIKMAKGKIYVNNSIVCKYVKPPSNAEILQLTKNQLEEVQRAKIIKDGEHSEREPDFVSFAFKARNGLQESERLNMVMQHIACAYRLDNPFEPYRQEAIDDGDHGVGREILKVLKDKEITHMGSLWLDTMEAPILENVILKLYAI